MGDEIPSSFLAGIIEASQLPDTQIPKLPLTESSAEAAKIQLPLPTHKTPASSQPGLEGLSPGEGPPTPHIEVKSEPQKTSREATPLSATGNQDYSYSNPAAAIDENSLIAVNKLKNEHGLRSAKPNSPAPTLEPPKPISRKRPAPKSTKKGVASIKKQPSKKRKVESDTSRLGTPASSHRSITPVSSRASKPSTLHCANAKARKSQSGTPATGSSPAPEDVRADPESDFASAAEEGNDLFCICRRPDNHAWMIACDGGCDDWLHGKCVNIDEEDGDLIDKYICPNCMAKDRGVTTWKPMCRAPGCRQPARLKKGNASKYCSDECGLNFFKLAIAKVDAQPNFHARKPDWRKSKTNKKSSALKAVSDGSDSDSADLGPRGGRIRSGELKALIDATNDIEAFRSLGMGMPSPPATASPETDADRAHSSETLNGSEKASIAAIRESMEILRTRHTLIRDREHLVIDAHENAKRYAEREGLKVKDVCGFDSRIVWSEDEFIRWRDYTTRGAGAASARENDGQKHDEGSEGLFNRDCDVTQPDSELKENEREQDEEIKERRLNQEEDEVDKTLSFMCLRKRCERHRFWQKVAMGDLRCEEADVVDEMRRLEARETEIRERAIIRVRQMKNGVRNGGTVELVENK